jgi:response regulator RpfG family c-di-GMP phosphodiesterase
MMTKTMDMSILYVEDDEAVREGMHVFLNRRFDQVFLAENGAAGLDAYRINAPDIVMTDINMPVMDGLDMIRAILEQNDKAAIIVTSAYNEAVYLLGAIELGVSHYLMKPLDQDKLDASLKHCIEIVRKTRNLNERENFTAAFYQTISSLLDCGEKSVTNAICLDSEVERQLDQMIENVLDCGVATASHGPASLIMTLTHGLVGQPQWLWYDMEKDRSLQKACYLDHPKLDLDAPVGSHALFIINDDEQLPDDPLLRLFVEHFDRHGEKPRNLIWYRNGCRIICALNYPGPVTTGDAVVIKNLAMQTRFLDTISAERHQTEEAFLYTITSLARAAEVNDEETGNHILRVGQYCAAICRQIGYPDTKAKIIEQQSWLHDVGKIHIPAEILRKPGKLTDGEMSLMREHTVLGAQIIGMHPRLEIARLIALHHHEHWDGSGYPYGLHGTAISPEARITAIADTYDALRNRRSYKPPFDHDTAMRIIFEGDGRTSPSHFAPDILAIFKKVGGELDEIYERLAKVE